MSRISIEHDDFKRGLGDILLGSICKFAQVLLYMYKINQKITGNKWTTTRTVIGNCADEGAY